MRFLTVKQPYAWALFHGKGVENRTQLFKYRGPVGIHAGTSWHEPGSEDPRVVRAARRLRPHGPEIRRPIAAYDYVYEGDPAFAVGAVIGVAQLVDCHRAEWGCCDSEWGQHYPRATHLVFEDPVLLTEPVAARGALGLWKPNCLCDWWDTNHVPNCGLERKVREQLPRAA